MTFMLAACGQGGSDGPGPSPTPTPITYQLDDDCYGFYVGDKFVQMCGLLEENLGQTQVRVPISIYPQDCGGVFCGTQDESIGYADVIVTKNGARNSYQVQFFNVENDHSNTEVDVPALLEGVFILKLTNEGPFDVTAQKIEI